MAAPLTFLCITTYEKGQEFMRECKRQGCRVFLLTAETLRNADWPRESLDDVFYIPADLPLPEVVKSVTYLARENKIDRIVALDEFDMETASTLREHMRIPGMGLTTIRYFRDKLAMRMQALGHKIRVPDFIPVLNPHARAGLTMDLHRTDPRNHFRFQIEDCRLSYQHGT